MKRKLIEMSQEHKIVCDTCEYKVDSETGDPHECVKEYVNKPCPACGDNLLTVQDYLLSLKVIKITDWINKWFSWILIFIPKNGKTTTAQVKCHKEVGIVKNPASSYEYEEFMNDYKREHELCPKCGSRIHTTTLAGFFVDMNNLEAYKDLNNCECVECGDKHKTHDRVSKKVFKANKDE